MARTNFWTGLVGVIVGAVIVTALPAIAQVVTPRAVPGANMKLGVTNTVNANTGLRGNSGWNLVVRNTGSGVPLHLITNGNGKPPMAVDSNKRVANLNADRVDGRHANQLIRAAYKSTSIAPDSNGTIVQTTIRVPKPGILLVGGSVEASAPAVDSFYCRVWLQYPQFATAADSYRYVTVNPSTKAVCATNGATVAQPGIWTVTLDIGERDTATFGNASLWAIWVAFDGDGLVP